MVFWALIFLHSYILVPAASSIMARIWKKRGGYCKTWKKAGTFVWKSTDGGQHVYALPLVASCLELWWSSPKILETLHDMKYCRGLKTFNHTHCCGDKTDLHDEKVWVVDIEANWAEQVLHPGVVGIDSIDEVLVPATNYHLKERKDCVQQF